MDNSKDYAHSHNPFAVAYTGLAIGDLAVEQRIAAWAELRLTVDPAERARAEAAARPFGGRLAPSPVETMERAWADAMLATTAEYRAKRSGSPIRSPHG